MSRNKKKKQQWKQKQQHKPTTQYQLPDQSSTYLVQTPSVKNQLRFTPYAWAKLNWFCHHGSTEIGGFGITEKDDLLLVKDFITVKQDCSITHVDFNDESVADFFDDMVDEELQPFQFARIWLHTHPGAGASPSVTDEATLCRVFSKADYAIMFILARGGETYTRLTYYKDPSVVVTLAALVDYTQEFPASDLVGWKEEYDDNIQTYKHVPQQSLGTYGRKANGQYAGIPTNPTTQYSGVNTGPPYNDYEASARAYNDRNNDYDDVPADPTLAETFESDEDYEKRIEEIWAKYEDTEYLEETEDNHVPSK